MPLCPYLLVLYQTFLHLVLDKHSKGAYIDNVIDEALTQKRGKTMENATFDIQAGERIFTVRRGDKVEREVYVALLLMQGYEPVEMPNKAHCRTFQHKPRNDGGLSSSVVHVFNELSVCVDWAGRVYVTHFYGAVWNIKHPLDKPRLEDVSVYVTPMQMQFVAES